MDGENNGKPYWNGWFGGKTHYFRKPPYKNILVSIYSKKKVKIWNEDLYETHHLRKHPFGL